MKKKDPVSIRDFETDKSHKIDDVIAFFTEAKEAGCNRVTFSGGDYEDCINDIEVIASRKVKKIKINKIKQCNVPLFDGDGNLIGLIEGEHQFNDVRVQIMESMVEGYYVMFRKAKVFILPNGGCSDWPEDFFDTSEKQLEKLVGF